ncbi:YfjI family protein [Providencia manganoxydans]|uniref:YfjI family protein n=1 Tax=Providencia manganoxydans TaxID=2923283 RepID=UPI0034E4ED55
MSKQKKELCFKLDVLPKYFQDLIVEIHAKTGAAAEIIFPTMLGVMAQSCQDMFDVKYKGGIQHPVSIFSIVLARSGMRKTTVYRLLTEKLGQIDEKLEEEFDAEKAIYERENMIWESALSVYQKKYQMALKLGDDADTTKNELDEHILKRPVKPVRKRLIINDTTSEGLAKELGSGYPVVILMSDEAGELFDGSLFRKTPLLNALWCGETKNVTRASSDGFTIKDARFGIVLLLQPMLFDKYLDAKGQKTRASGFLPRCLIVDLDNIPYLADISVLAQPDEFVFNDFSSILVKHLKAGIERRERNEERTCITFEPEAQKIWDEYQINVREMMKIGGELYSYDDYAARFMEHASRIAAVMQIFITPNSTMVTKEVLLSALHITEWYLNHFIEKVDYFRELSDTEKLVLWLEEHLVSNKSYDFRRNDIIKKGPFCLRRSDRLIPALKKLEDNDMIQQFEFEGKNYIRFIGAKMEAMELAKRINLPIDQYAGFGLSKLKRLI